MFRILTHVFLRFITILAGVIFSLSLNNKNILEQILYHNKYLQYICSMTKLYDFCNNSKSVKQEQLGQLLQGRLEQQQKSLFTQWLSLPPGSIETPSLTFTVTGKIVTKLDDDMTVSVEYISKYGPIREMPVLLDKSTNTRSFEVSKKNNMMQAGLNKYTIILRKGEKIIASVPIRINSHAQEISLGQYILYLDTSFKKDQQSIIQEIPSFDGHMVYQLQYGCFDKQEQILIKTPMEYLTVNGCLQYDPTLQKILLFKASEEDTHYHEKKLFDITTVAGDIIYKSFPLFVAYFGQRYQNFISYEFTGDSLGISFVSPGRYGNDLIYQRISAEHGILLFELQYDSLARIRVKNRKESATIRLYKDQENVSHIHHPGLSYNYSASQKYPTATKRNLLYPLTGFVVTNPSLGKPTWNLSFAIAQDSFSITDSIKNISFSIEDLLHPLSIDDIQKNNTNCNKIETKIITAQGQERYHGVMQTYFLVIKNHGNYNIQVKHNGEKNAIQYYGNQASVVINKKMNNLTTGANLFEIGFYDNHDVEICKRSIPLFIE